MRTERFYAVAQTGPYGEPVEYRATFHGVADHAVREHDERRAAGEDVRVYRMEPIPDDAMYDWGITSPVQAEPQEYVSERAARASLYDGCRLMRRRAGTDQWEQVAA